MKSNLIKKLIRGLSFTTALFVFQSCYGTPQDFGNDIYIYGFVKSQKTGLPVKGIKISVPNNLQYEISGADGSFSLYTELADSCRIKFEDIDSGLNGSFFEKDTVLMHPVNNIFLDILLEEK
jgi:hypothetical protein